jgi:hypothetical protein
MRNRRPRAANGERFQPGRPRPRARRGSWRRRCRFRQRRGKVASNRRGSGGCGRTPHRVADEAWFTIVGVAEDTAVGPGQAVMLRISPSTSRWTRARCSTPRTSWYGRTAIERCCRCSSTSFGARTAERLCDVRTFGSGPRPGDAAADGRDTPRLLQPLALALATVGIYGVSYGPRCARGRLESALPLGRARADRARAQRRPPWSSASSLAGLALWARRLATAFLCDVSRSRRPRSQGC